VSRLSWIHSRHFSTASCTEVLDFATSVSCWGPLTAIMMILSRGLPRAVHRSQAWMQMSRHRYCVHFTILCVCHNLMSVPFAAKLHGNQYLCEMCDFLLIFVILSSITLVYVTLAWNTVNCGIALLMWSICRCFPSRWQWSTFLSMNIWLLL